MAGNKNSGDKSYHEKISLANNAKEVLDLSMSVLKKVLMDENLDIETRLKAAIPIASKHFPDKIEIDDVNALTREEKFAIASGFARIASLFASGKGFRSDPGQAIAGELPIS